VDALKTSITNGLTSLCGTNHKDENASCLDNLHSLLKGPDTSTSDPSISHIRETTDNVNGSFHVAQQVQQEVCAAVCDGNMKMFSTAYVSSFIVKQLFHVVNCHACKACQTSQAVLSTSV
jgi:hypothetical protein